MPQQGLSFLSLFNVPQTRVLADMYFDANNDAGTRRRRQMNFGTEILKSISDLV